MIAPAKVNLYLAVGALRPDGYHEVETVLHAIDLSDTVVLERASGLELACPEPLGVPAEENLAYLAAAALARRMGREPDVLITLTKRVPAGAGLGGASSDAAAVLAGLPVIWDTDVPAETLIEVAAGLGADVPFFLTGGTALYGGRGDVLLRRVDSPALHVTLIKPSEPVPTAAAYATFDRLGAPTIASGASALLAACESGDPEGVGQALYNNMTAAAVEIVPEIADIFALCDAGDGVVGRALAGSGSAVFAVCDTAENTDRLATRAREEGYWSCATRSVRTGVYAASGGQDRW